MFYKLIFTIGQRLRNPSIKEWSSFLKLSEKWSITQLESYQLRELKALLHHAYHYTTYYKTTFDEAGFHPDDVKTLADLSKVPLLSKQAILENVDDIHADMSFKMSFRATTSGSSGDPLVFQREELADSFNRASIFRGYSWYNVQPWEKNGYFWGFDFSGVSKLKTRVLDALQHRFRVFDYKEKGFKAFVKKMQDAKYIHGYSSMIYQSAKLINEKQLPKPKQLKMVKGTSEKIYDSYKSEIQEAFGVPIISEYGAAESGIIAFECPEGNMHINMEGVIVESVDNEIVVTNLQMKAFPVIRYQLGDYIELAAKHETCSCGKAHYILKEVTGRVGENVYGNTGTYPSLYFYYIFKNLNKKHQLKLTYQIIQQKKGELTFKLKESLSENQENLLKQEIYNYFGDDISFTIVTNHQNEDRKGKIKSFISHI